LFEKNVYPEAEEQNVIPGGYYRKKKNVQSTIFDPKDGTQGRAITKAEERRGERTPSRTSGICGPKSLAIIQTETENS